MTDAEHKPTLVMIVGLPGSGKTTLAKKLENQMPATRFCPDETMAEEGIDLFNSGARDEVENRQWLQAQELLKNHQNVVLENGFWGRSERDDKRQTARELGANVELCYLEVPIDELWRRVDERNRALPYATAKIERNQLDKWFEMLEEPNESELKLYDNLA